MGFSTHSPTHLLDLSTCKFKHQLEQLHASAPFGTTSSFQNLPDTCLHQTLTNQGCLVVFACFTTASSNASFLGVQPSECQKNTEKTRKPPLTFTHAWAILRSLPEIESIAPSSAPTTAPKLLPTATKTPSDVCFRSSVPALSSFSTRFITLWGVWVSSYFPFLSHPLSSSS